MDIEKTRRVELELCKWNRQGWCLQERALSRRIVYFGESQLHFELKNDSGEVVHLESQGDERAYFKPNRLRPEPSVARNYSSNMWWESVNSSTQRQLTFRNDRPLAIRGLAASVEEAGIPMFLPSLRSEISLRGTASNDFVASLLWYVDKNTISWPSSEADKCPTWSWLSVDGVVFNDSTGEVHENSTLSLSKNSLILRLFVTTATTLCSPQEPRAYNYYLVENSREQDGKRCLITSILPVVEELTLYASALRDTEMRNFLAPGSCKNRTKEPRFGG
jgi:hypothetical protein